MLFCFLVVGCGMGAVATAQTAALPTVSISDATINEGGVGETNELLFIVTLSSLPAGPVVVDYVTIDGSARGGSDFLSRTGKLTFVTFDSVPKPYELRVKVMGDNSLELNESMLVRLSNPTNAILKDPEGTGLILNDDGATLRIEDDTVVEADLTNVVANFNVVLSGIPTAPVSVGYTTVTGTAGTLDFKSETGRLTFAAGETRKRIPITVYGDRVDEPDETFQVRLTAPLGATLLRSQAVGTIVDNDVPSLSLTPAVLSEGDQGSASQRFNVRLNPPSITEVRVHYEVVAGTASPGTDFVPSSGTLLFPPGIAFRPIDVQYFGDLVDEPNETFLVRLSAPEHANIVTGEVTGTIVDDDPAPTLHAENIVVAEGDAGETEAVFVLRLSAPSENVVTVEFQTSDTTAVAGVDYGATNGVVAFPPGVLEQQVRVPVRGDLLDEPEESFALVLSGGVNTLVDPSVVRCRILDDDPPEVSVADAEVTEGDTGTTNLLFRFALSSPSPDLVSVRVATRDLSAVAGVDFDGTLPRVEFLPGRTNSILAIPVTGDLVAEGDETFTLLLLEAEHARIAVDQAVGTILDNDLPLLSVGDLTVIEGTGTEPTLAHIPVELSQASSRPVRFDFVAQPGAALVGVDFGAASGTFDLPAGSTSGEIVVPIVADSVRESPESFFLRLAHPVNATLERDLVTVTIADDDAVVVLSVADAEVDEGNDSARDFTVVFRLSAPSEGVVSVLYDTADDTATAGKDYFRRAGQVVFEPGKMEMSVPLTVLGDRTEEPDEKFKLLLASPVNVSLERTAVQVLIHDDDGVRPTNAPPQVAVVEPGEGATLELGVSWTISAAATDTNGVSGTVTNVAFYGDGIWLGDAGVEPFRLTLRSLAEGPHILTARATDNGGLISTSAPVAIRFEGLPQLRVEDLRVGEAESPARFHVTLSRPSPATVTVDIATAPGTAAADRDFVTRTSALIFPPGETNQWFEVTLIDDPVREREESFTVTLGHAVGAVVTEASALGNIVDNDPDPLIDVGDVQMAEGEGNGLARFIARLSHPSSEPIQLPYGTTNRTAFAGADYTATQGVLTIPAGNVSGEIQVPILGDLRFEEDEQFDLILQTPTNAVLFRASTVATLINDDNAPLLQVTGGDIEEGQEGQREAVFLVRLVGDSDLPATFDFSTEDGTATVEQDYFPASGAVRMAVGINSAEVRVTVLGDRLHEEDESFRLRLAHPLNCALERAEIPGLIRNDDPLPVLRMADARLTEGDEGSRTVALPVELSEPSGLPVTVEYATADGSAQAGSDYTAVAGTLVIPAGETKGEIRVAILGDPRFEGDEEFEVRLSSPLHATLDRPAAKIVLGNDDLAPTLQVGDVRVSEGNDATAFAVFTATLSAPSAVPVNVAYATVEGTASQGTDFDSTSGTLSFAPGELAKELTVVVRGDRLPEKDEDFFLRFSAPTNLVLGRPQAIGVIVDDDAVPTLRVNDAVATEGDGAAGGPTNQVVFHVILSAPAALPVSVTYETESGSAEADVDFVRTRGVLVMPAGTPTAEILVPLRGDRLFEADEGFVLRLAAATNVALLRDSASGSIRNDDPAPSLRIGDARVGEGDSGRVPAVFVLTLSNPSGLPVTSDFASRSGSAVSGTDFLATSGTVTFAPGVTVTNLAVEILGDTEVEADETFALELTRVVGATLLAGGGSGVIANDDHVVVPTNRPPSVHVVQPLDRTIFTEGDPVTILANALDADGTVARVEFRIDGVVVAEDREAPFTWTWVDAGAGDHRLEVRATDKEGAVGVSEVVRIAVSDVCGRVAIVGATTGFENEVLQEALFELGVNGRAFDRASAASSDLDAYDLVIWNDVPQGGPSEVEVALFERFVNEGKALYFIGESLVGGVDQLPPATQARWVKLTRMQPDLSARAGSEVVFESERLDPEIELVYRAGKVGTIPNFPASIPPPLGLQAGGPSDYVLARSGSADVLVAFLDATRPALGRRLTQAFRVGMESGGPGAEERVHLFQNAIWWLLNCRRCSNLNLTPLMTTSVESGRVGDDLIYAVQVQSAGGCEALSVRLGFEFPATATFVAAQASRGTWSTVPGGVSFYLGRLPRGAEETLQVTLRPGAPGPFETRVWLRSLNENFGALADNELRLATPVAGAASLSLLRTEGDTLEIGLLGMPGVRYGIESATSLTGGWTTLTNVTVGSSEERVRLPRSSEAGGRFYRARE